VLKELISSKEVVDKKKNSYAQQIKQKPAKSHRIIWLIAILFLALIALFVTLAVKGRLFILLV